MQKALTCCFTGHRRIPPEELPLLRERLTRLLRELVGKGVCCFIAGGALGFDMLAAETVIALRETLPQIRLRLALPCENQHTGWSGAERARYSAVLEAADEVIYTSREYAPGCMHLRNRYMVDNSAYCIAYLKQPKGGTAYTVRYALQKQLRICNLAPEAGKGQISSGEEGQSPFPPHLGGE